MKDQEVSLGIALGAVNPYFHEDLTVTADELGFESVWLPEHLVFTSAMTSSPHPGQDHPPVPSNTPIFDAFANLAYLAGLTQHIKLGTHVYNIGLRHPFVSARAVQTLDILSRGRAIFGIGASWLESEWVAAELDFASRAERVGECIEICKLLWTQEETSFHGRFFSFDGVVFEPKPAQYPYPPILVGGESKAALRRAARYGDGWVGMAHTFESVVPQISKLRELLDEEGRESGGFEVTITAQVAERSDLERWAEIGVTRLIVSPWQRGKEAIDGVKRLAGMIERS